MVTFSKESLERLRQRIDLVDVLSAHIELKRTGASYKGLCPFHDEKTPSFMVQKGDHHYHCFGCGAHGDAIQFMMTHLKMSFFDAVESLAQRFHVVLDRIDGPATQGPNKTILKEAMNQAARFFHFFLLHTPEGHQALQYLYERGIDIDFIRRFMIGLAPPVSGMLRQVLQEKGVKEQTMIETGLLSQSERGVRDFFIDRITFPIQEASGAVIGFSARKYKEETFGGKYINTSETALFKKSRVLFGLNHSRKRIAKERRAIVVEGQIDALRLIHVGFDFTVAGQGTAFGEGHVKELTSLGVEKVFLAMDADNAGQQATSKIGHLFQKEGVEVRVVQMPPKLDPDAFLRQFGPDRFEELLENSGDYISFQVMLLGKTHKLDSPAGKHQLLQELVAQIRSWEHPVMVHESLRKLAFLTNVPESMLGVGQEHVPNLYIKKSDSIGMQTINPDLVLESDFLRWLLLMGDVMPKFLEIAQKNVSPDALQIPVCQSVYQALLQAVSEKKPMDILSLTLVSEHPDAQTFFAELHTKMINKERAEKHFIETVQKILDRNWMQQREAIKVKLHSGRCSDEEELELSKQFNSLIRQLVSQ